MNADVASAGTGPQQYKPWRIPDIGLEMLWIDSGSFLMGSPSTERDRLSDEGPQTEIHLTYGFWLGKYPVTQIEYTRAMGWNPSTYTQMGEKTPVHNVSWENAAKFCERLTLTEVREGRLAEGWQYALPTEAQWEYACRAGTRSRFSFGDDDSDIAGFAWFEGNSDDQPHPVGDKRPNEFGLYDMHGNVLEWCADWDGDYPGGRRTDWRGPSQGWRKILRGGAYYHVAHCCRSACRTCWPPDLGAAGAAGFRVALVFQPDKAPLGPTDDLVEVLEDELGAVYAGHTSPYPKKRVTFRKRGD